MKFKITYRAYDNACGTDHLLDEFILEIGAWFFEIKNGFVSIWTERNKTQIPDFYINANDVLIIEPIA